MHPGRGRRLEPELAGGENIGCIFPTSSCSRLFSVYGRLSEELQIVAEGSGKVMARIRVGSGFGKVSLTAALQKVASGDRIVLDPGTYETEQLILNGVQLEGATDRNDVFIHGSFIIKGHCTFRNLTLNPLPYKNGIYLNTPRNMATITNCAVLPDPSGKYPAIWAGEGNSLVLKNTAVQADTSAADAISVQVEAGTLHATTCELGRMYFTNSKADLIDSGSTIILAADGSRVRTYGSHRISSEPKKRMFVLSGQSVCEFPHLELTEKDDEGFADNSLVQIGEVVQSNEHSVSVITKNEARVNSASSRVRVIDQDAAPEPPPSRPKTITWPLEHAGAFDSTIAPQLSPGDTVLLEQGDYVIEGELLLLPGVRLQGKGKERTRLIGCLRAASAGDSEITDLTVATPSPDVPAVLVGESDAHLTLEQVTLEPAAGPDGSNIVESQGALTLRACSVDISTVPENTWATVLVSATGRLEAVDCGFDSLHVVHGASASLSGSFSYALTAEADGTITVTDEHHSHDNGGYCEIRAADGGTIHIPSLTASTDDLCISLEGGTVDLTTFGSTDDETFKVVRNGGEITGIDPGAYDLFEVTEGDEAQSVHFATRGASAQAHDRGLDSRAPMGVEDHPDWDDVASSATDERVKDDGDPLTRLYDLVGLAKVKKQVQSIANAVKLRQKRLELGLPADSDFTLHSMFLGNPGTGKTTVARLLGKAMHEVGAVISESFVEVGRAQLVSDVIGGTAKQTREVLESGRGGVIFIDEAYSLATEDSSGFAQEAITEILTFLENNRSDTMVILAGYNEKMHELLAMNEGFKSRIKHRLDFEDYSPAEIAQIGLAELARGHYTVDEELYRRIVGAAYAQSADRSNARWVRNFNQDLRSRQEDRVILIDNPTREDLITIEAEDLHALAGGRPEDREAQLAHKLAELDSMIGLGPVKEWVHSLVGQATVNQRMLELDGAMERPNYHVAFTGNPGTGKTTVARTVAEVFHLLGILSTPTVESVPASQLQGRYLGHSAANTHQAFDAAMGGVLFIDEAHQLRTQGGKNSSFKQEIVDAMITRLEDDRDKFVAIFAGYTDEMHEFFRSDPGLKSRVPAEIEFPDYTSEEVAEIACRALAKQWRFDAELLTEIAASAYTALPAEERSNGRWARTFTEEIITRHNRYVIDHDIHGEEMLHITEEVLREFQP